MVHHGLGRGVTITGIMGEMSSSLVMARSSFYTIIYIYANLYTLSYIMCTLFTKYILM